MKKQINIAGMSELVSRAVANSMQKKASSNQFSPDSDSDAERTGTDEPKVNPKLQNTGEGYEQAGVSEFGLQAQQDLIRNQVDVSIPDKGAEPDTRAALDILHAEGVQDALMSAGDPTMKVTDPQTASSEPAISEKLQLKKDAAAIVAEVKEAHALGQKIIDYMMAMTVNKQASASESASQEPAYTKTELLQDVSKLAAADSTLQIKEAWLAVVEDALYAANVVSAELKMAANERAKATELQKAAEAKGAESQGASEEAPAAETKAANAALDPAAAEAMQQPMGGEIPQAEAEALFAQSLAENGVNLPGEAPPMDAGGAPPPVPPPDAGPAGGAPPMAAEGAPGEVDPQLLQLLEELEQMGYPPEEVIEALETIQAETNAGIAPEAGAVADEEAEKTGHYKYASFINRPRNKTAEQEQKAARTRKMMRDIIAGPNVKDFN